MRRTKRLCIFNEFIKENFDYYYYKNKKILTSLPVSLCNSLSYLLVTVKYFLHQFCEKGVFIRTRSIVRQYTRDFH